MRLQVECIARDGTSLNAMKPRNKPTDNEHQPITTASLGFWGKQKLKLIEQKMCSSLKKQRKHSKRISYWMPRWQIRMRKRLGQVQIVLHNNNSPEV